MKPNTDTPAADAAPSPEPRNVVVRALQNRTKIGKAIVAAGRVDFPVTASEAKALKDLGLVEIEGVLPEQ